MSDNEDNGKAPGVKRPTGPDVFQLIEDVLDKLKVLNYEEGFCKSTNNKPLSRVSMCFPDSNTQAPQFPYFASLVAWLLAESNVHDFIPWTEYDNPMTVANTIITQCRSLGLSAPLQSAKLRQGYGDNVLMALDFLTSHALTAKNFQVEAPSYEMKDFAEAAPVDEEAEVNDVADEVVEEEETGVYNEEKEKASEDSKNTQDVIENTVDPIAWKLQLENVGPRLKWKPRADASEWRTHLEQSEKHRQAIQTHSPDASVSLQKIGTQLTQVVERIAQKERHINQEFDHLGQDFREKQKRLDEVTEYYNKLNSTVAAYTDELTAKGDEIEMIKAQMTNRNKEFTDPSPLRTIGGAISSLKKEIGAMELRIGILSQTLLHAKVRRPHE